MLLQSLQTGVSGEKNAQKAIDFRKLISLLLQSSSVQIILLRLQLHKMKCTGWATLVIFQPIWHNSPCAFPLKNYFFLPTNNSKRHRHDKPHKHKHTYPLQHYIWPLTSTVLKKALTLLCKKNLLCWKISKDKPSEKPYFWNICLVPVIRSTIVDQKMHMHANTFPIPLEPWSRRVQPQYNFSLS